METKTVRIGGGAGFWGDSPEGPRQLVGSGEIDYLVLDYLAEVTMSIMSRMRTKDPASGYATDFVTHVVKPLARQAMERKIRIVTNAGGVNPLSCCDAIRAELREQGIALKVVAVMGDDILPLLGDLPPDSVREMGSGAPMPPKLATANSYLGAFPIAAALAMGADIVVTGRCADSALALGPLIHEFGWTHDDLDQLAGGSLAGHVIECGPQSTGGFFTDWRDVCDTWASIGFPIAQCRADGSFVLTKPQGTGGLVNIATVAEQIAYETGDPQNYILPDVICDMAQVKLTQLGPNQVEVSGIKGLAPTDTYKVSGTYADGYRSLATLLIRGQEAVPKARAIGAAILQRTRDMFQRVGLQDYLETSVELLGAEEAYGPQSRGEQSREVVLKVAVRHAQAGALDIFSREIYPASTGMTQGIAGVFGGRPKVQPMVRLFSFLIDKKMHTVTVHDAAQVQQVKLYHGVPPRASVQPPAEVTASQLPAGPSVSVPLSAIAYGRSGDKGDISNIAVLARRKEFESVIAQQLTAKVVASYMAHLAKGEVQRFAWPGLMGFNFLLHEALGGGGVASLRYDPQGKSHAQILMDFPVSIPSQWVTDGLVKPGAATA